MVEKSASFGACTQTLPKLTKILTTRQEILEHTNFCVASGVANCERFRTLIFSVVLLLFAFTSPSKIPIPRVKTVGDIFLILILLRNRGSDFLKNDVTVDFIPAKKS